MFIPYIQQRRMQNLQGFGATPTLISAASAPPRMFTRSLSGGSCPDGWQPIVDTRGAQVGCVLNAYIVSGMTCDGQSPPAFDSAGKQIGCMVPVANLDPPVMADLTADGRIVDKDGNDIVLDAKNAISENPGKSLAVVALAGIGLGAMAFAAQQYFSHHKGGWT